MNHYCTGMSQILAKNNQMEMILTDFNFLKNLIETYGFRWFFIVNPRKIHVWRILDILAFLMIIQQKIDFNLRPHK